MVGCIRWKLFAAKLLAIMKTTFKVVVLWANSVILDGPTVNLDRVSHKIVSLRESGSNFVGKAKILGTPMGKIAQSLIDEGVKLGFLLVALVH